ncbi:MAG: hypothetical protein IRZ10_00050 [Thermoflavifilum sp.]|nr:hypothetical protein [Thermoflavifilum sp.]MCL6512779.1 hypothetical protein [Alicyclobacillus sp.]
MSRPAHVSLPVNLQVRNIRGCSAVLIGGYNIVYGWSAHSKTNNGLGSVGSSNVLYANRLAVIDPDAYDTPIDDRDVHLLNHTHQQPAVTHINMQALNVNTVQQNAGVLVGDANMTGWDTHQKTNKGQGDTFGHHNAIVRNVPVAFDPDCVDAPIADQDMKFSFFSKDSVSRSPAI